MSTLSLRLPNSLHSQIKELAKAEGISINQFISTAAAEKISAMLTEDFLIKEAKLGRREDFEAVLRKVPDVPPDPFEKKNKTEIGIGTPRAGRPSHTTTRTGP